MTRIPARRRAGSGRCRYGAGRRATTSSSPSSQRTGSAVPAAVHLGDLEAGRTHRGADLVLGAEAHRRGADELVAIVEDVVHLHADRVVLDRGAPPTSTSTVVPSARVTVRRESRGFHRSHARAPGSRVSKTRRPPGTSARCRSPRVPCHASSATRNCATLLVMTATSNAASGSAGEAPSTHVTESAPRLGPSDVQRCARRVDAGHPVAGGRQSQGQAPGATAQIDHAGAGRLADDRLDEVVLPCPAELGVVDLDEPRVPKLGRATRTDPMADSPARDGGRRGTGLDWRRDGGARTPRRSSTSTAAITTRRPTSTTRSGAWTSARSAARRWWERWRSCSGRGRDRSRVRWRSGRGRATSRSTCCRRGSCATRSARTCRRACWRR